MQNEPLGYFLKSLTLSARISRTLDPTQKFIRYVCVPAFLLLNKNQILRVFGYLNKAKWVIMPPALYFFWGYVAFMLLNINFNIVFQRKKMAITPKKWLELERFVESMPKTSPKIDQKEKNSKIEKNGKVKKLEKNGEGERTIGRLTIKNGNIIKFQDNTRLNDPKTNQFGESDLKAYKLTLDENFESSVDFLFYFNYPLFLIALFSAIESFFGSYWVKPNIVVFGAILDRCHVLITCKMSRSGRLMRRRTREEFNFFLQIALCFFVKWFSKWATDRLRAYFF